MSTLGDDLNEIVRRNEEHRRQAEAAKEIEAKMGEEAVDRSYELEKAIQAALDELAEDDRLPIRVDEPNPRPANTQGWAGWDILHLNSDAEPQRELWIRMIHDARELQWAWLDHPQQRMRWHREDVTQFRVDPDLKRLLAELVDDSNWSSDGRHR